jgi:hypothetical protein
MVCRDSDWKIRTAATFRRDLRFREMPSSTAVTSEPMLGSVRALVSPQDHLAEGLPDRKRETCG